jgi:hypothetical protein
LIKQRENALLYSFLKIHHIWPDFRLRSCITKSITTGTPLWNLPSTIRETLKMRLR